MRHRLFGFSTSALKITVMAYHTASSVTYLNVVKNDKIEQQIHMHGENTCLTCVSGTENTAMLSMPS